MEEDDTFRVIDSRTTAYLNGFIRGDMPAHITVILIMGLSLLGHPEAWQ